ncbi:MFS transporter [Flavitalea sp. BT771]|uniref:MFS transporter n=1 Tax=Flavitalea sp. BT771 TaxID=3063329 RepID=UPI0026E403AB|nr:MFS transporter [Flavitalea sp. BT771]MDO6432703.1 MFS transporter [Flavitalea sp. BT771]MDV6222021.1 MFS transporter [Flavitalea sp. BT771]
MKIITRTVWILSMISLFTDIASEMLYPIMPLYLKSIGFSVLLIGILEGVAEATAGLSKGYFGRLSDRTGRRMPFVQWGYGLSALSKPLLAFLVTPLWVFFARTIDRLGKGLRTGARDAVLSEEASPATKGRVFGFHRSMDTLGAVIGPVLALIYLQWHPQHYKALFVLALAPGVLAVGCSFLLKDRSESVKAPSGKTPFFSFLHYWRSSPAAYKRLVTGLLIFALFNSSDVFLLLKAKQAGLNDSQVIGVYIFYNLVYAAFAYPMGILADKIGLKFVFLSGLLLFTIVYIGMAFSPPAYLFYVLFFLYGMYAAATEGVAKAWISNITPHKDTATAIGTYAGFQSICSLLASSIAGVIWFQFGASMTFLLSAIVTFMVCIYFLVVKQYNFGARQ